MMTRNLFGLAAVTLSFAFLGCEAEKAVTSKAPLRPIPLQYFSTLDQGGEHTQLLLNNKFFFWKEALTPNVAEKVLRAAKQIDLNEDKAAEVKVRLETTLAALGQAQQEFDQAIEGLDEKTKETLRSWRELNDEKSGMLNEEEIQDNISKTESELKAADRKLDEASRELTPELRSVLKRLGELATRKATLEPGDPAIDDIQKELEDLAAGMPELSEEIQSTAAARDTQIAMLEAHYGERLRRRDVDQRLRALELDRTPVPNELTQVKTRLESLYDAKESQFHEQIRIGKLGEALVSSIIANTDYFEGMPERVAFNFSTDAVSVTIKGFPQKSITLSTQDGTISNVRYEPRGGVLRFEAHPSPDGAFYRFRVCRIRTNIKDGRVFYQGDMDLYQGSQLVRRGIAKLASRSD